MLLESLARLEKLTERGDANNRRKKKEGAAEGAFTDGKKGCRPKSLFMHFALLTTTYMYGRLE